MRYLASQLPFGRLGAMLSLMILSVLLTGCPDKKPKFPNCHGDKDCKDGQHCFQQTCSQCSEDSHCKDFETCNGGSCILRDGMCNTTDDCTAGQICEDNKCTACESDAQCGSDSRCSNGACLERGSCQSDEDCADDEDCLDGTCQRPGRSEPPKLSCNLDSIYFGLDEFSIPENSRESLQQTSICIQQGDKQEVLLEGHTDDLGTDEYNIALSEKRGRSVADFLARLGIDPARLHVVPKGESEATATDEDSRSEERRVDFEWQ